MNGMRTSNNAAVWTPAKQVKEMVGKTSDPGVWFRRIQVPLQRHVIVQSLRGALRDSKPPFPATAYPQSNNILCAVVREVRYRESSISDMEDPFQESFHHEALRAIFAKM